MLCVQRPIDRSIYRRVALKHIEKRFAKRHACKASAVCSYFNTGRSFDAQILNFSESGLYLEARESLQPGTTLLILIKKYKSKYSPDMSTCLKSISLVEVRWCNALVSERNYPYGAGLKQYSSDV